MEALSNSPQKRTFSAHLQNLNSLLLVAFAFVLPLWIAPSYIIAGLICFFWLLQGDFRSDFEKIRHNKLVWAVVAYFLLHVIGLLWTSNLAAGPNKVARASLFLLVPVFMMVLNDENVEPVIWSFLVAMIVSCIFSFLIYFRVDPVHFKPNGAGFPIYFMSHIHYSVYLAFAIAFSVYYLLFEPSSRKWLKIVAGIVSAMLIFDLFICEGRAGQVIFFVFLVITIFQYFGKKWIRALIVLLIAVPLLFAVAYTTVKPFRERVQAGVCDIRQYQENKATSLGQRFVYAKNSFNLFLEHPLFGVGTGDFENELEKIHKRDTPDIVYDVDPHNMYLLEMGQFGIFGLIVLLSLLLSEINIAFRSEIPIQKYLGFSMPIMFALIMFSDIYLQLHFTAMLFILLSAIVYRDYSHHGQLGVDE
ncbi:MAG: O-antigen ligase family protein [Chlorobaculum sp.]